MQKGGKAQGHPKYIIYLQKQIMSYKNMRKTREKLTQSGIIL